MGHNTQLGEEIRKHQDAIVSYWMAYQMSSLTLRRDLVKESELRESSRQFLVLFGEALATSDDTSSPHWKVVKDNLGDILEKPAVRDSVPLKQLHSCSRSRSRSVHLAQQRVAHDGKRLAEIL